MKGLDFYLYALVASAFLFLVMAAAGWQRRHIRGSLSFSFLMLGCSIYTIGHYFELRCLDISQIFNWVRFEYIGLSFIPTLWLLFILQYTDRMKYLKKSVLAALFLIPVLTFMFVLTNEFHHLYYRSLTLATTEPLSIVLLEKGPWYLLNAYYQNIALAAGSLLLVYAFWQSGAYYKRRFFSLWVASLLPWASSFVYQAGASPLHLDLVPFGLMLAGLLVLYNLRRHSILDLLPIARAKLFENIQDSVLVLDSQNILVDMNRAASDFFGVDKSFFGQKADPLFAIFDDCSEHLGHSEPCFAVRARKPDPGSEYLEHSESCSTFEPGKLDPGSECCKRSEQQNGGKARDYFLQKLDSHISLVSASSSPEGKRWIDIRAFPLFNQPKLFQGWIVIFRDVTKRKQAENLLKTQRDLALSLGNAKEIQVALDLCLGAALEISEMESGAICLRDETANVFRPANLNDFTASIVGAAVQQQLENAGIQLHLVEQPVYVSRRAGGALMEAGAGEAGSGQENLPALAVIPVRNDKVTMACLVAASRVWQEVPAFSRTALETIAGQIGQAVARFLYEEKLRYFNTHDALTGLYNRAFFEEEMERLGTGNGGGGIGSGGGVGSGSGGIGSGDYPITIIAADLDGLKQVNDNLGHLMGDTLLRACGEILQKAIRSSDLAARLGGDEFAIILTRAGADVGRKVFARIQMLIEEHNNQHPELPLSISLGSATADDAGKSLQETYKEADDLMYRQKRRAKDVCPGQQLL